MGGWTVPEVSNLIGVPIAAVALGAVALFWAWLSSLRADLEMERLAAAESKAREDAERSARAQADKTTTGTPFDDFTRRGLVRSVSTTPRRPNPTVEEFLAYIQMRGELERFADAEADTSTWYPYSSNRPDLRRVG